MFYYKLYKNTRFFSAISYQGSTIKEFKDFIIVGLSSKVEGQNHLLIDDIDNYINPGYFKDYWHLRETLPFTVRVAIEEAEANDPEVKAIMGDMKSAPVLDREDPAFIQGVAVLQNKGLLTQEQANNLLFYEKVM